MSVDIYMDDEISNRYTVRWRWKWKRRRMTETKTPNMRHRCRKIRMVKAEMRYGRDRIR